MRSFFVLPFLMLAGPALAQQPSDAVCAATFSALSASARAEGLPSAEFDRMADIAARHAGGVTEMDAVRDLTLTDLQGRVVNCHARYDRSRADTRMAAN